MAISQLPQGYRGFKNKKKKEVVPNSNFQHDLSPEIVKFWAEVS